MSSTAASVASRCRRSPGRARRARESRSRDAGDSPRRGREGRAWSDCNIFSAMTPPTLRPLSVGEILDDSFSLYRRHFVAARHGGARLLGRCRWSCACSSRPSGGMLQQPARWRWSYYVSLRRAQPDRHRGHGVHRVRELSGPPDLDAGMRSCARPRTWAASSLCSLLTALVVGLGFLLFVIPGIILVVGLIAGGTGGRARAARARAPHSPARGS